MNTAAATAERTKTMVMISLMAAVICILGPLSLAIPISPVPISLTNLAVYFTIYVLGTKKGTISYLIYLLIGLIGIPVFSGFTGGPAKLLGPTGGYLIGFIFMALLSGLCISIRKTAMCTLSACFSAQQSATCSAQSGWHGLQV